MIIRTEKYDPSADPLFYRVDFRGTEAGTLAIRQTVLKMANFGDNQVVLQSLTEVRFVNVINNKVHGLFTYDIGDIFEQRDIFVLK